MNFVLYIFLSDFVPMLIHEFEISYGVRNGLIRFTFIAYEERSEIRGIAGADIRAASAFGVLG
jgi:hypothetical protein